MRKVLSIVLALLFVFSFGVAAFAAGDGSGTGGGNGDGSGGGNVDPYDATVDGPGTLTLTCMAGSSTYSINSVSIPFNINVYPTGGLKHIDGSNLSQTINSSTVVLTCNGSVVSGFSPSLSNIYCNGDKHNGYFNINIRSSVLKAGNSYTLTIKAGASWENQPKNRAVLNSDYSYSFSVAADAAPVETTTAESKQNSPLTTKSSQNKDKNSSNKTTKAASDKSADTKEKTTEEEKTTGDETTTAAAVVKTTKAAKTNDKSSANAAPDSKAEKEKNGNAAVAAAVVVAFVVPTGTVFAVRKSRK